MFALHAVTLLETVHASASIDELLLAGKEGVALGANFNLQFTLDRAALESVAASATNDALTVIGMDSFLHVISPLSNHSNVCALITSTSFNRIPQDSPKNKRNTKFNKYVFQSINTTPRR